MVVRVADRVISAFRLGAFREKRYHGEVIYLELEVREDSIACLSPCRGGHLCYIDTPTTQGLKK